MLRALAIAAAAVSLGACGLKGDLYLPPRPADAPARPAAEPAATDPAEPGSDAGPAGDERGERRQVPAAPDRGVAQ